MERTTETTLAAAVSVSVEVAPAVTGLGAKLAVTPVGRFEAESVTGLAGGEATPVVTVRGEVPPAVTVVVDGSESVKSGGALPTVTLIEAEAVPPSASVASAATV